MVHLWCRSLVQGRPHINVGLTRRQVWLRCAVGHAVVAGGVASFI